MVGTEDFDLLTEIALPPDARSALRQRPNVPPGAKGARCIDPLPHRES
jgi:hypothetical protein